VVRCFNQGSRGPKSAAAECRRNPPNTVAVPRLSPKTRMTANTHAHQTEASSTRTTPAALSPVEASPEVFTTKSQCPECNQYIPTIDVSEAVCPDCQIDIGDPLSRTGQPWYDAEERQSRKQTARRVSPLFTDKGIGTHGNLKDRAWTKDRTTSEYRLGYALGELRRIGSNFELSEPTLESAALLYREAYRKGLIEGRCIDGFTAASLLIAVRQSSLKMPVSRKEIQRISRASDKQFRTARTVLEQRLELEVPPMHPEDFLPKATSELNSPRVIEQCARKLLRAKKADSEFRGTSPRTLAAAAIYAAYDVVDCEDTVTLAEVSDILDVSTTTISSNKSQLTEYEHVW